MAGNTHEALVALFREHPSLGVGLARAMGQQLPSDEGLRVVSTSENLSQGARELRPDAVVVVGRPRAPQLVIVVEVQLASDGRKRASWPLYEAAARARYGCPTLLLVVAPSPTVARQAARPILLGNGGSVRPLVLSPADVKAITDPQEAARTPALAVLSAIMHAKGPPELAARVALAAEYGLQTLPGRKPLLYSDAIESELTALALAVMEAIVSEPGYEWKSEFARRHRAEGRKEGLEKGLEKGLEQGLEKGLEKGLEQGLEKGLEQGRHEGAQATLVMLLTARFGDLPPEATERLSKASPAEIERWLLSVLHASSLGQVFSDEG